MPTAEDLGSFAVFGRLSAAQRAVVAGTAQEVCVGTGTRLFAEGDNAVGCWLIRDGTVALETSVPARGKVVVQTVGPGEVLGWSWLVPAHHWHFTASALEPVAALRLDTVVLHELAQQDPALGYPLALGLLESMLALLQSTRARLLDLYGNPRERAQRASNCD